MIDTLKLKFAYYHNLKEKFLLILSQRTSPFPVKPGKQVQLIVLNGKELWTSHSAFGAHGRITLQGF